MYIMKRLLKTLLFIPPIIGTFIITILYAPTPPLSLLFTLLFLWLGSGLLAFDKASGSVMGLMSPILLLIIMKDEYMHVNPLPYAILYMIFYSVAGLLIYKSRKGTK